MVKIRLKSIIVFFLLGGLLFASYLIWRASHNNQAIEYRTDKAKVGNVVQSVSANGTLNPVVLVNVGTQVTGKVKKLYADFNQQVQFGDLLLELDDSLFKTEVAQSEAAVKKAQANLKFASANLHRGKVLAAKKFISRQDLDQLVNAYKSAKAELNLSQAKLTESYTTLGYATIRSPVSGVIVDRQIDVGQTVTASFQTPILFKIAKDLSKMQIDSNFAEADIGNIVAGQEATFTVDAFPDKTFTGVVKQIRLTPTVQQNVVTYNVVVMVDNKSGLLLPGMTAYVTIKTKELKNVLLVSNAALRFKPKDIVLKNNNKQPYKLATIYKLDDGKLVVVQCGLGIADNNYTEIKSGNLKNGDEIVIGYTKDTSSTKSFKFKAF